MTHNTHAEDPLEEIMSKMRIGDYLHVPKEECDTSSAVLLCGAAQPCRIVHVGGERKPRRNHVGLMGYTPAQLEQLYYSDTRILIICAHCGHSETILPDQLKTLAEEHKDKNVAVEFGCHKCLGFDGTLLIWTALAMSQELNGQFAPLYDRRQKG